MLTKTDAVVVRSMKYGDTSKIVTFYTRQFGKLKGIAKGARRRGNKFGASLEPMSYVTLVLYKKEHRDLHLISQCDQIRSFGTLQDSIEKMSAGLSVLELVDGLSHEEEENHALFSLIVETLSVLDSSSRNYQSLARSFQLKLASLLGYAPSLNVCVQCGKPLGEDNSRTGVGFQLTDGAVQCSDCTKLTGSRRPLGYRHVSAPAYRIMQRFLSSKTENVATIACNESVGNEIDETLRLYFRYHFEHMRDLKSVQIFKSIV